MSQALELLDDLVKSFDIIKPDILFGRKQGAFSFVAVSNEEQKEHYVAMVLGSTDKSRHYHIRHLNGTCRFVKHVHCIPLKVNDWTEIERYIQCFYQQLLLPPIVEWSQVLDDTITSFFPSFVDDPHYEQSKYIYLKAVYLLKQSKHYITQLMAVNLNDIQYSQLFHDIRIPEFVSLSGFGNTFLNGKSHSWQIQLNVNYLHDHDHDHQSYAHRSAFDAYASIFMGAITLYHEILHWLCVHSCSHTGVVLTPYHAEIATTTGLWSCDWAVDNQIFNVFYWKISRDCPDLSQAEARKAYETGFVVDAPFIVAFVNDYKGNERFWNYLESHLSPPDQLQRTLLVRPRTSRHKGCLTNFYRF